MRLAFGIMLLCVWITPITETHAESPHFNYMLHCQGCHLADGSETPGKIPALIGAGRFLNSDRGRRYIVQVPGVAMSTLPDDELAALVNWMLETFSADDLRADFEPYTAEEVADYRKQPLVEVDKIRAKLLGADAE